MQRCLNCGRSLWHSWESIPFAFRCRFCGTLYTPSLWTRIFGILFVTGFVVGLFLAPFIRDNTLFDYARLGCLAGLLLVILFARFERISQ